jgi:8-oxo-dGTP diphosphatase
MASDHHSSSRVVPAVGVGAMIRRDNKILLAKRRRGHGAGYYCWPGGGLEFHEKLGEGLAREVFEESDLVVESCKLICVNNIRSFGHHYIDFEFLVTDFRGVPRAKELETTGDYAWYDLLELPQPLFLPCKLALLSLASGTMMNEPDVDHE